MSTIITASDLQARLQQGGDLLLVDVRLPEDFEAGHLPGAVSQCVFEVAFSPEMEKRGSGAAGGVAIVVYGAGEGSHESRMAAEKLERAGGGAQVLDFRGGLEAWVEAGYPLEGETKDSAAEASSSSLADGRHDLDLTESRVIWVGRNLINKHWGHVALSSGSVTFQGGALLSGEVVLDLRRITSADLAASDLHDVLIHHLESDDFFDVANHPEARFTFDRAEECAASPGCRNLRLHGALTLRGLTHPLTVEACAGYTPEGKAALQATFTLDRTDWGVLYGSGKFFRKLAGHLVNDEIELQVRMITE